MTRNQDAVGGLFDEGAELLLTRPQGLIRADELGSACLHPKLQFIAGAQELFLGALSLYLFDLEQRVADQRVPILSIPISPLNQSEAQVHGQSQRRGIGAAPTDPEARCHTRNDLRQ